MVANRYHLATAYVAIRSNALAFHAAMGKVHATLVALQARLAALAAMVSKVWVIFRRFLFIGGGAFAIMTFQSARFEQSMARVGAITGAVGSEFESLRQKAMELGRTTQYTASQAAEAMSYFALAGFKSNEIIAAMPDTLNLAAAGQLSMGEAADIVAKIMKGMGLETHELSNAVDVLTAAFTGSNTTLPMLGDAFKMVGPIAKAAKIPLEQITAAIMTLSNAGMQATMAGTGLRGVIAKLSQEGKAIKKVFGELGVSIQNTEGGIRPLADIIEDVNTALRAQGKEAKLVSIAMNAFGLRAGPAFAELVQQGADSLRNTEKYLRGMGGVADRVAKRQLNTLIGSLKLLWSAIESAAIQIGDKFNPVLRGMTDALTSVISSFKGMSKQTADNIVTWSLFLPVLMGFMLLAPKIVAGILAICAMLKVLAVSLFATKFAIISVAGATSALVMATYALAALAALFLVAKIKGEDFNEMIHKQISRILGLKSAFDQLAETMDNQGDRLAIVEDATVAADRAWKHLRETAEETEERKEEEKKAKTIEDAVPELEVMDDAIKKMEAYADKQKKIRRDTQAAIAGEGWWGRQLREKFSQQDLQGQLRAANQEIAFADHNLTTLKAERDALAAAGEEKLGEGVAAPPKPGPTAGKWKAEYASFGEVQKMYQDKITPGEQRQIDELQGIRGGIDQVNENLEGMEGGGGGEWQ